MSEHNPNSRLEAFCDAVFAIALTLLIIDIKFPDSTGITDNREFWLTLRHIVPSIFTFVLSFMIILITWVNHHHHLRLVNKTSVAFIYANGFMLLTIVFIPFPTSILGEYLTTVNASPAVILYDSLWAIQAISWILLGNTSLRNNLAKNEHAANTIRQNRNFGYFAFMLYSAFAILAIWFPITIAIFTFISWAFWLVYSLTIKSN